MEATDTDGDGDQSQRSIHAPKRLKSFVDPEIEDSDSSSSSDEPAPIEDFDFPHDIEDMPSAPRNPPTQKAPKSSTGSARVLKAAKGAVLAAAKKVISKDTQPVPESASGKKRIKRTAVDIGSDDETLDASKKKFKAHGRNLIPAQTNARTATSFYSPGNAAENTDDGIDADISSAPARGKTASKAPRGKQTGRGPTRAYGGT